MESSTTVSSYKNQRKELSSPGAMNFLGCDFHTVHGAFKAGVESTGRNLKKVMKGFVQILEDSTTWREDFVCVTGSNKISLEFYESGIDYWTFYQLRQAQTSTRQAQDLDSEKIILNMKCYFLWRTCIYETCVDV